MGYSLWGHKELHEDMLYSYRTVTSFGGCPPSGTKSAFLDLGSINGEVCPMVGGDVVQDIL